MRRLVGTAVLVLLLAACGGARSGSASSRPSSTSAAASTRLPAGSSTSGPTVTTAPAGAPAPAAASRVAQLPAGDGTTVTRVVDGDTIVVAGDVKVRLIGVDTPETVDPRRPVGCFGHAASAHTSSLLPPGTHVRLEYDVERLDRYERTLAYVYRTSDHLFVNDELVRDGFANVDTVPPDVAHVDRFVAAGRAARAANRGLWAACPLDGTATSPPSSPPSGGSRAGCDPAYPDVCIPPPPPDLDCADVPYHHFRVLAPDPHHFDGDGDGYG